MNVDNGHDFVLVLTVTLYFIYLII